MTSALFCNISGLYDLLTFSHHIFVKQDKVYSVCNCFERLLPSSKVLSQLLTPGLAVGAAAVSAVAEGDQQLNTPTTSTFMSRKSCFQGNWSADGLTPSQLLFGEGEILSFTFQTGRNPPFHQHSCQLATGPSPLSFRRGDTFLHAGGQGQELSTQETSSC